MRNGRQERERRDESGSRVERETGEDGWYNGPCPTCAHSSCSFHIEMGEGKGSAWQTERSQGVRMCMFVHVRACVCVRPVEVLPLLMPTIVLRRDGQHLLSTYYVEHYR